MHAITLKSISLYGLALLLSWTPAVAVTTREARCGPANNADDWLPILDGVAGAECPDLAVIFARGTFDECNLGPWVGGPFSAALTDKASNIKVAIQGVSTAAYPADLAGYIEQGGSDSCAENIGSTVQTYASRCPDTKMAIWGWSQGALCARKSLGKIGDAAEKVIALGVFGDPISVWEDTVDYPAVPETMKLLSYCQSTPTDPLCGNPAEDFPTNPVLFINRLKEIWEKVDTIDMNDAQKEDLASLVIELPAQFLGQLDQLAKDIPQHWRRWFLTPPHFWYGNDGTVETAAEDLLRVYKE
ncbi:carbohydrate esterase family 5 protein [Xylariomycetidae sp. FL2044]|nr:carbohydrate esterase family 5 protein [Xylariomycetidae sp. FL2044]